MILVLSGPNLTLELSTFGLLEKNKFFSRRPPVKVPKYRNDPERTDIILLKLDSERFDICCYQKENKLKLQKLNLKVKKTES